MTRVPKSAPPQDALAVWTRRELLRSSVALTVAGTCLAAGGASVTDYLPAVTGRPPPPESEFSAAATAENVTAGLKLAGKTALVTGCNSGIGLETMRVLSARGVHVFGAARTLEKAEQSCSSVPGSTTPIVIELSDFEGIVGAADEMRSYHTPLDMLILNAGVMAWPDLELVNGVEHQFAVNHLGHFLLVDSLKDLIVSAMQGRVVVVSSSAHVWAHREGIRFDNLAGQKGYDPFEAYGQSKLANGLFSRELARRIAHTRATSNSLHPGYVRTRLTRYLPGGNDGAVAGRGMKSIPQGAATSCYLATHPGLEQVTGYYFADCNPALPNAHMQDDKMAARLWEVSEELTRPYLRSVR